MQRLAHCYDGSKIFSITQLQEMEERKEWIQPVSNQICSFGNLASLVCLQKVVTKMSKKMIC